MLKAFSKAASKSIVAFVQLQLRNLRRRAFHRALSSGFQRLEPRRVLTVQGIFDAVSGNLSVNITPGDNTTATVGSLDATQFFLDVDGNSQFDNNGLDLFGLKSDLKNIFVTGTADPLANIGRFVWQDHSGSTYQLDQISANDLSSISLDLTGRVSVLQSSNLQASSSVVIHNTALPLEPTNTFLRFSNDLNVNASGPNGSIFVNLDYTLTVDGTLNLQASQGTIALSDIDAKELIANARGNITDADSGLDTVDIRADKVTLTSTTGSIGGPLSNILTADIHTTNAQALEIAARTPGSLDSSLIATQGTVSIFSSEFPSIVDTNKLWIGSDANIQATDLSGISSRVSDLALIIDPANNMAAGILSLPDSLAINGDLRIQANSVTATDGSIDLQANRVLWNSIQDAEFTITANQIDAQSQNNLRIKSTQAIAVNDLNNDQSGLQALGTLALETQQGSITLNALVNGSGSTDILLQSLAGGIIANANIQSGSGDITLSSQDALVIENRIRTTAPGTIVLESQGSVTIGQSSGFD
ncbi:MAG: hypothetical protein ACK480_16965, partial [Planctomycetota bacterium]